MQQELAKDQAEDKDRQKPSAFQEEGSSRQSQVWWLFLTLRLQGIFCHSLNGHEMEQKAWRRMGESEHEGVCGSGSSPGRLEKCSVFYREYLS